MTNNRVHQASGERVTIVSALLGRFGATPLLSGDSVFHVGWFNVPNLATNWHIRLLDITGKHKVARSLAVWGIDESDREPIAFESRIVRLPNLQDVPRGNIRAFVAFSGITRNHDAAIWDFEYVENVPEMMFHKASCQAR